MKELRITKGEWKYRDHFSDGIIETIDWLRSRLTNTGDSQKKKGVGK